MGKSRRHTHQEGFDHQIKHTCFSPFARSLFENSQFLDGFGRKTGSGVQIWAVVNLTRKDEAARGNFVDFLSFNGVRCGDWWRITRSGLRWT
ncbi:unnamed protein product [Linum trigynum]|uniref:Uncharacterized protein n=1 Tax=Linum trigynum TaxID=586398 RepID=A0AAV2GDQ9_9ROSI